MQRDHGGFRDFATHADRIAVLAAALYSGEAFQRSFRSLGWAVGRTVQPNKASRSCPDSAATQTSRYSWSRRNLVVEYNRDRTRVTTAVDSLATRRLTAASRRGCCEIAQANDWPL